MQTKEQVEKEFRAKLQALLDEYGADLESVIDWRNSSNHMEVIIPSIYDEDGSCLREWTEIDLGGYVPPSEKPAEATT